MVFMKIYRRIIAKLVKKLGIQLQKVNDAIANDTLPKFGNSPKNVRIDLPRYISNPDRVFLGDDIWLGPDTLIIPITEYPTPPMRHPLKRQVTQRFEPRIIIGNRVTSTARILIAAFSEISIGDDVMFASNVNITDGLHGYAHANEPYKYQNIFKVAPISIKRGCWIGQNVVIMPGVTIGELAIVGANSVVTRNIPDRCIASGTPARVSKKWNEEAQDWVPSENGRE